MRTDFKIKCISPGNWFVEKGDLKVSIYRSNLLDYDYGQWLVTTEWDQCTSDPIIYLKDAKVLAIRLIEDKENGKFVPNYSDLI